MTAPAVVRICAPSGYARTAVDQALGTVPLVILAPRIVRQLEAECGSAEQLAAWILKLVTRRRRPIGLHDPDIGRSWFYAPKDWTSERLQGYLSVYHTELEAQFGPMERIQRGGLELRRVP
jgi:hypothetical protein